MEELSIKEKARRYDEAIKRAKELLEIGEKDTRDKRVVLSFFPELKENGDSEDDKIRKSIIEFVKQNKSFHYLLGVSKEDALAWLEKQGEKKSVDKVDSKFNVGDWVVSPNGVYWHIDAINNNRYEVSSTDGVCVDWPLNTNLYHLWTIQDVKDGDVLVYYNGCVEIILLFKEWRREVGKGAYNYAHMTSSGHYAYINGSSDCGLSAHPATKEQRDALEKAMADVGYIFDFGKKELKKIENKPEWSEEDERDFGIIYGIIYNSCNAEDASRLIEWLKSLKDRVQPKQEWSNWDKTIIESIEALCDEKIESVVFQDVKEHVNDIKDWLKSLRPQSTWKPSDAQMASITCAVRKMKESACYDSELVSLFNDLKKLKG